MSQKSKVKIVILGGDISGPMTAAKLARYLPSSHYDITFISPPRLERPEFFAHVPPSVKRLNRDLKFREVDFIKATSATFSLGTGVVSKQRGFIPFGPMGPILSDTEFHHVVQRARPNDLYHLVLPARLAEERKFLLPQSSDFILSSGYDYGYHVDIRAYAKLLTDKAIQLGCRVMANNLSEITWDDLQIKSLQLDNGEVLKGDIYIDGSGSLSKLCPSEHKTERVFIHHLPSHYKVHTKAHGQESFRSSAHALISSTELSLKFQTQAKTIQLEFSTKGSSDAASLNPGWLPSPWKGNVISMGLSAFSLPPIGGWNLRLIDEQISRFIEFLPSHSGQKSLKAEYNRMSDQRIRRVVDYAILFYHPEEDNIAEMAESWPDAYYKYKYFKSRGDFAAMDQDEDCKEQWLAMLLSKFGWPEHINMMAQDPEISVLMTSLNEMEKAIEHIVDRSSDHRNFIASNCAAPDFVS